MCFGILFLTFWFGILDISEGLTNINLTIFHTTDSMKYKSLSATPSNLISQVECGRQCDQSQCLAASYHQQLQQCYLHSSWFGDLENATGWNILQKRLKTIYINQEKSWDDSQAHCASLGGRLAVVDTAEKRDLIKRFGKTPAWLGASDRSEEGTWVWYNPTQPVLLDYWASGEPNNDYGIEHCMVYKGNEWDDRPCYLLYDFICDIPEIN